MATYKLNLEGNYEARLRRFKQLAASGHEQAKRLQEKVKATGDRFNRFNHHLDITNNLLARFTTVVAGVSLVHLGRSVVQRTAEFEGLRTALNFASGSMLLGATNMKFVERTAKELGLALLPATEGYTKLTAAARNTKLTQRDVRELYQGISKAISVLALNSEKAHGTFMAFEQIMSKGKVSAEELRRQLGDRIPGAFQIAARSMGITTSQLDKLLKEGKLLSEDFLPQMARQLNQEFTPGVQKSGNTLRAHLNRLNNQLLLLKVNIGTALIPELTAAIRKFNDLDGELKAGIGWLSQHKKSIFFVAKAMAVLTAGILAYTVAVKSAQLATALWNSTMLRNPLLATIALLGTLTANYVLFAKKVGEATDAQKRFNNLQDFNKMQKKTFDEIMGDLNQAKSMSSPGGYEITPQEALGITIPLQDQMSEIDDQLKILHKAANPLKIMEAQKKLNDLIEKSSGNRTFYEDFLKYSPLAPEAEKRMKGVMLAANARAFAGEDDVSKDLQQMKNLSEYIKSADFLTGEIFRLNAEKSKREALINQIDPNALGGGGTGGAGATPAEMAEVLGGGNRIINITIHKQIENYNNHFDSTSDTAVQEASDRTRDAVRQGLLEAVNEGNKIE